MASFWSKLIGKDGNADPRYSVPSGVHYFDYAALQAAKNGIFIRNYTAFYRTASFIKWDGDGKAGYFGPIKDEDKAFLAGKTSVDDLYKANIEKLRHEVKSENIYINFIDLLFAYLRGQAIAEQELAEAEQLRIEAQRAQALVGAYRLNLHDSPLMAELAATQDMHLLREVAERLKTLEEEHVKSLPAVKLFLSSLTPVEELLTSGSSQLH